MNELLMIVLLPMMRTLVCVYVALFSLLGFSAENITVDGIPFAIRPPLVLNESSCIMSAREVLLIGSIEKSESNSKLMTISCTIKE